MRNLRFALLLSVATLAIPAVAAEPAAEPYTMADYARLPKIDAHVHANVADGAFLSLAKADNFELISINVDYPDFPPLPVQAEVAHKLARDPHFHFATTFSMKGFGTTGWAEAVVKRIAAEKEAGAVAVKIWKNVGMVETDAHGAKIMLDDPGLDPVVAGVVRMKLPLLDHQGEPKNCWLPLPEMTTDNDREYFQHHPAYYMYLHPQEPAYETLMTARDRFVAKHPDLTFVGAHMASLEWSVDRLSAFLDRYPNASVDLAARMTQMMYQSAREYDKVRAFFVKYQDRLIYATDLTENPGDDKAEFRKEAEAFWLSDWRYLATADSQTVEALHADIRGLALPRAVVEKIYYENARRIYFARR